jgi:HD-GYP domain-containing protein (c-di-GMP phosphodiesterase class II)
LKVSKLSNFLINTRAVGAQTGVIMKVQFTELILQMSQVLDYVETELVGVLTNHGKRVAYLSVVLGQRAGLTKYDRLDLAAYAVLHDNALTQYIQSEYIGADANPGEPLPKGLGHHSILGERNLADFPFYHPQVNAILHHHENADGSGPFQKTESETNLYAALIHLTDQLDVLFDLKDKENTAWKERSQLKEVSGMEKWEAVRTFAQNQRGKLFGETVTQLLLDGITDADFEKLSDEHLESALREVLDYEEIDLTPQQLINVSAVFAKIVDYKSTFTSLHSLGIAQKAYTMAKHYGLSEEDCAKFYFAGAVHDIGKLAVDINILEKPDKLTLDEFEEMKKHALITYEVLSKIPGMEDISKVAAYHHEKLNGNGYPFGYAAKELGKYERLLGCLDIYQALREDRPYKAGKTHAETMAIMTGMVSGGFIDQELTKEIDLVFKDT